MRDYFFQIVMFLAGAFIGIAVPLLDKPIQKRIATILAVFLVATSLLWAGYELGVRDTNPAVAVEPTLDTPTPTLGLTDTPTSEPTNTPIPSTDTPTLAPTHTPSPSSTTTPIPIPSTDTSTPEPTSPFASTDNSRYGMVTAGIISDKGFNQISWDGMLRAKEQLGVEVHFLESQQESDYQKNLNQFIQEGYNGIISVSYFLADATKIVSEANPNIPIAIVDFPSQTQNDMGLLFAVDEPSFLVGYLSAGMTKTGIVCTYGGMKIPPVVQFMVAFEHGVLYYNQQHGTAVQVRGWRTDPTINEGGEGIFAGNFESFNDGRRLAEECFNAGGDIIFPVAGLVGIGSASVAKERGLMMIGVDNDYYIYTPEYRESYLTSVQKNVDLAVFEAIAAMESGVFQGGNNYIGTVGNGVVGLAPFHDFEDDVPDQLKAELTDVANKISSGEISTGWPIETP